MTKFLPIVIATLVLCGCDSMNLKTRDDIRNGESAPAKQNAAGKPVEVHTPPPDKQDELDTQMRQLNGRVDVAENQVNQTTAVIENIKEQNNKDRQAQDQKINSLEEAVKKLELDVAALNDQLNKKPVVPVDPEAMIKDADGMAANKKYKEAIVAYQKYRDNNPKGARYAEVTYKIGTCFQDLGMKDEAKAFYEEVVTKHPKSKDAKAATKRLKSLK